MAYLFFALGPIVDNTTVDRTSIQGLSDVKISKAIFFYTSLDVPIKIHIRCLNSDEIPFFVNQVSDSAKDSVQLLLYKPLYKRF